MLVTFSPAGMESFFERFAEIVPGSDPGEAFGTAGAEAGMGVLGPRWRSRILSTHADVLELRPNCELCDKDLPPDAPDARICSYECTFCAACVEEVLQDVCPNCGGGFQVRPVRPRQAWREGAGLDADPAGTRRGTRGTAVTSSQPSSRPCATYRQASDRRNLPPGRRVGRRRSPCEHMFVSRAATILHADLDAFFASVEQRDDPRLRGRPVIVGGGVVLAASYEAKAYGIKTAMGGRRALRLCPHAVVVPPRMSVYSEASKAVFEVFEDTTPLVEGLSIDEAFLDVRGLERLAGSPTDIAERLRRKVRSEVGLPITVGIARTKFLAKVASAVAKPNGLLLVPPDDELGFLHPLPVERLWGVGRVTAAKLHDRGQDRRPGRRARRGDARQPAGARLGSAPARARAQSRSTASANGSAPALYRVAASARAAADVARGD